MIIYVCLGIITWIGLLVYIIYEDNSYRKILFDYILDVMMSGAVSIIFPIVWIAALVLIIRKFIKR